MNDLPERLRRLYAWNGTNHVQEAADEIERLRAERDALAKAFLELHATVVGECPSLLNELWPASAPTLSAH